MASIPVFEHAALEAICAVLGETGGGLTGSEIGTLLARGGIHDPSPTLTKRHRLFAALHARQAKDGVGNHVIAFVQAAMDPVRYVNGRGDFDERRAQMNQVIGFAGYLLGEDGKVQRTTAVRTVSQAEERAGRLRAELQRRRVHSDVLKACRAELLQDNYFHAVLEATKSVAEKVRARTGLTHDGSRLIDDAFGLASGQPRLAFNSLRSDSERSEHLGMMNLMKGIFSTFRNPTAHEPRTRWAVAEDDALDLLSLVSLVHRRLDGAVVVPMPP